MSSLSVLRGGGGTLRQLLRHRPCVPSLRSLPSHCLTVTLTTTLLFSETSSPAPPTFFSSLASPPFIPHRPFSSASSPSSGSSNIVIVKSSDDFKLSLSKAQDESLPSIFYFTAAWCGPCELIAPIAAELSSNYPHVKLYKVDINVVEMNAKTIDLMEISFLPTFLFIPGGKQVSEIEGANIEELKDITEKLFKLN